ncbi:MAG: lipoyl(octanoyl) transferase LipB [Blastocatellia bacterium]|nr:lipoyl(octanoyl) transferase LipB [Blastocatellia bacterium]
MTSPRPLHVWFLGLVDYADGLRMQEILVQLRREEQIPDTLLLLEHPPVLTLGRAAERSNIVAAPNFLEGAGIEVFETGRGGDVTFHGPGQLVGYPIFNLHPDRRDVRRYMRDLEEVLIQTLGAFGVTSGRIDGLTGVWVGNRKIAAMGVRISRWLTSHGFALNVNTALDYFNLIVPCGIRDKGVTSLDEELGRSVSFETVMPSLLTAFGEVFEREVEVQTVHHESVQIIVGHRHQGKTAYLLLHRLPERGGFWQPVTGTIKRKRQEPPMECATRELFEETGFTLPVMDLEYVHSFLIDPKLHKKGMVAPAFNREFSFAVRVPHREVILSAKEHDAFEWLSFEQARDRMVWRGNLKALELADKIL